MHYFSCTILCRTFLASGRLIGCIAPAPHRPRGGRNKGPINVGVAENPQTMKRKFNAVAVSVIAVTLPLSCTAFTHNSRCHQSPNSSGASRISRKSVSSLGACFAFSLSP